MKGFTLSHSAVRKLLLPLIQTTSCVLDLCALSSKSAASTGGQMQLTDSHPVSTISDQLISFLAVGRQRRYNLAIKRLTIKTAISKSGKRKRCRPHLLKRATRTTWMTGVLLELRMQLRTHLEPNIAGHKFHITHQHFNSISHLTKHLDIFSAMKRTATWTQFCKRWTSKSFTCDYERPTVNDQKRTNLRKGPKGKVTGNPSNGDWGECLTSLE